MRVLTRMGCDAINVIESNNVKCEETQRRLRNDPVRNVGWNLSSSGALLVQLTSQNSVRVSNAGPARALLGSCRFPLTAVAVVFSLAASSPVTAAGRRSEPEEATSEEVDPDYEEAARLRRDAEDRFFEEDYDGAIANFEAAYGLSPHPTDLFNMGRIFEEKGELEQALRRYEEFVAQPKVSLEERGVAAERIKVLRELVYKDSSSSSASGASTANVVVTDTERGVDKDKGPPVKAPLYSGIALLSIGSVAALAGGLGFGLVARRESDKISDLDGGQNPGRLSLSEAEDLEARGKDFETFQIVSISVGAAIAVAGVGLLTVGLVRRRNQQRLQALAPVLMPRFVGVNTSWRF